MSESVPPRILVVAAHPDDIDFSCSASIASWTAAGAEVAYVLCTSGDAGGFDDTPRDQMAPLREQEQRDAAAAVGVDQLTFLRHRDGALAADQRLRRDISREIRRFRPGRVIGHSPEILWERIAVSHPDHRAAGEATLAAVYPDARNPFAHPELLADGLDAWTVPELWLIGAPPERVNHAVDVTEHFDRKLAALAAHRSQTAHLTDLETRLRTVAATGAHRGGLADGRLAEVFQVVHTA